MAYLAGMIWSVSMLAPNFHALPRMTFGKVMGTLPLPGGGIRGGGLAASSHAWHRTPRLPVPPEITVRRQRSVPRRDGVDVLPLRSVPPEAPVRRNRNDPRSGDDRPSA